MSLVISDKTVIGSFPQANNAVLMARQFVANGKKFLTQVISSYPDAFYVRGRGMALVANTDTVKVATLTDTDAAVLEESDTWGVQVPDTFTLPFGYVQKNDEAGNVYYVKAADLEAIAAGDSDGDGTNDIVKSANIMTDPIAWVKENVVMAAIGAVVLYVVLKPVLFPPTGRGRKKTGLAALLG